MMLVEWKKVVKGMWGVVPEQKQCKFVAQCMLRKKK